MIKHKSGTTRSNGEGKIDYAHLSAIFQRCYCEYMHLHRVQEDGELREPDNYKNGMPLQDWRRSLLGHIKDMEMLIEGNELYEQGEKLTPFDVLMGTAFNLQGLIHELMRDYKFDRRYTNGKLAEDLNERFNKGVVRTVDKLLAKKK